jgi:hypothetical protein
MRRLIAALLCVWAETAVAQAPQEDAPPPEYEQTIVQALAESQAGRFEEARVLFRRAHALYPNARTLRGIGMVAFEVRDYPDSIRNLRAALASDRRPLTEEQRAEAERLLEQAYGFVGRYDLAAVPDGARVIVDGHEAELEEDGTLILAVGAHAVQVRTEEQSWDGRWTVRGGEQSPLPIVFDEPPVRPVPEPAPPAAPPDNTTPMALAIGGAALAAIGIALAIAGYADILTVEGAAVGTRWDTLADEYDRAAPLTGVGAAAIVVGGAAIVGGSAWLVVNGSSATPSAAFGVRVGAAW